MALRKLAVLLDTRKFDPLLLRAGPQDDLYGAVNAGEFLLGQPDLAERALADGLDQAIVGDVEVDGV